jgi:hypothetical protein
MLAFSHLGLFVARGSRALLAPFVSCRMMPALRRPQAWVYAGSPAAPGQSIVELSDSPTASVMSLFLAYGGKTVYAVDNRPEPGAVRTELVSVFPLPRRRWTHVAVTQSSTDATMLWDGTVVVRTLV